MSTGPTSPGPSEIRAGDAGSTDGPVAGLPQSGGSSAGRTKHINLAGERG